MSLLARVVRLAPHCPPAWKVARAVSEPEHDPTILRHLEAYARCAALYESQRGVVTLARSLPAPGSLAPDARQAIAAHLWRSGAGPDVAARRWRRRLVVGAIPAAAAALLALALVELRGGGRRNWPAPAPAAGAPASLAAIHAFGGARFARTQAAPDEIVRLFDGRISLDVTPIHAQQRFRVMTDDAVVEVRGTSFELSARAGSLVAASVSRGRVEVRAGSALAVLDAGDRWERAESVASPAVLPAPPRPEPPAREPKHRPVRPSSPRRASTDVERAMFARGWSSLRAGHADEAAGVFAELQQSARGSSIEEDALYWLAVAEARRHDDTRAARLFEDFLQRFPRSGRQGEAATALGWLLVQAGDGDGARRAFERAASDPSPAVRASAREGLQRTK